MVSTASYTPLHGGKPLAMTSMRHSPGRCTWTLRCIATNGRTSLLAHAGGGPLQRQPTSRQQTGSWAGRPMVNKNIQATTTAPAYGSIKHEWQPQAPQQRMRKAGGWRRSSREVGAVKTRGACGFKHGAKGAGVPEGLCSTSSSRTALFNCYKPKFMNSAPTCWTQDFEATVPCASFRFQVCIVDDTSSTCGETHPRLCLCEPRTPRQSYNGGQIRLDHPTWNLIIAKSRPISVHLFMLSVAARIVSAGCNACQHTDTFHLLRTPASSVRCRSADNNSV